MPDSSITPYSILASQSNFKIENDKAQGGDDRILIKEANAEKKKRRKNYRGE